MLIFINRQQYEAYAKDKNIANLYALFVQDWEDMRKLPFMVWSYTGVLYLLSNRI